MRARLLGREASKWVCLAERRIIASLDQVSFGVEDLKLQVDVSQAEAHRLHLCAHDVAGVGFERIPIDLFGEDATVDGQVECDALRVLARGVVFSFADSRQLANAKRLWPSQPARGV